MRKIFDCFIFNNEFDILELRVNTVQADFTHIVIGSHTFQGRAVTVKELKEKKDKIKKILDKSLSFNWQSYHLSTCYLGNISGHWEKEDAQREMTGIFAIQKGDPDDLFIFSDVDEIPKPEILNHVNQTPVALGMPIHYFGINYKTISEFNYPVIISRAEFQGKTVKFLMDNRNNFPRIPGAGWHFTWIGGVDGIREKVKSYSHVELNKPELISDDMLNLAIASKVLTNGEQTNVIKVEIDETFPKYILDNMDKFKKYILP